MLEKFTKKKQSKNLTKDGKICFPAISIVYDNKEINCISIRKNDLEKCYLWVKSLVKLEGDIDIISRLSNMEKEGKENKVCKKVTYEF